VDHVLSHTGPVSPRRARLGHGKDAQTFANVYLQDDAVQVPRRTILGKEKFRCFVRGSCIPCNSPRKKVRN
jgi:hypothetical protein